MKFTLNSGLKSDSMRIRQYLDTRGCRFYNRSCVNRRMHVIRGKWGFWIPQRQTLLLLFIYLLPFETGFVNCGQLALLKPLYGDKAVIHEWTPGMLFISEYTCQDVKQTNLEYPEMGINCEPMLVVIFGCLSL